MHLRRIVRSQALRSGWLHPTIESSPDRRRVRDGDLTTDRRYSLIWPGVLGKGLSQNDRRIGERGARVKFARMKHCLHVRRGWASIIGQYRRRRAEFDRPRRGRRIADSAPRRRQGLSQARRADGREVYRQSVSLGRLRPRALLSLRDAVVLDENGNLAFRGRIDDQIKIRRLSRRAWRD